MTIDWLAAVLCWTGNFILIKKKSWYAFVIFLVANSLWFFYWITKHEIAAMILVGTFMLQNAYGIYEWRKTPKS
jgi:hypothetical protein